MPHTPEAVAAEHTREKPHARRRSALRARLAEAGLDALLVVDLCNIRYLTGFTGSNAALLIATSSEEWTVFCTDGRYEVQAAEEVPDLLRTMERPCAPAMARRASGDGHRVVGFESRHVTVDGLDALRAAAEGVRLVRAAGHVEELRQVKDEGEVEALRMACSAADRALAELIERGGIRPGRSERDVAREL